MISLDRRQIRDPDVLIVTEHERLRIVREARRWIGTPFHHRASVCGHGADCLGLIRGVWRALIGCEPEPLPDYAPDWAEATGAESLLEASRRHLIEIDPTRALPGDVLLFRIRHNGPARHAGIFAHDRPAPTLIHAWSGRAVAEVPFERSWSRRAAHAFRFPFLPPAAPE